MEDKRLFFGQYLHREGLVGDGDIFRARMLQKKHNRRIGELALEKGWISPEEVEIILTVQEENQKRFGEIAVSLDYLSEDRANELIREIDDNYLFIGEALVELGVISEKMIKERLKDFQLLHKEVEAEKRKPHHVTKDNLMKRRLGKTYCEFMERCTFFAEKSSGTPELKLNYCFGNSLSCARYLVYMKARQDDPPNDLRPDQKERVQEILNAGDEY
jgi:hypothetical protein